MNKYMDEFVIFLRSKGLRLTEQRKLVLQLMHECKESQMSIEEIFKSLKVRDGNIGLSTVYRTLILLEELDLVHRLHDKDGYARYQFMRKGGCQYICSRCGSIQDADKAFVEAIDNLIQKKYFTVKHYKLNINGGCSNCN
ncbi:MAG: ferric uptake regulation protein [Clostridia bacterium]|nr:ferric uptake regulation protein [Clostridia bacterium]